LHQGERDESSGAAKELVVIRIERWFELIANDLPELRGEAMGAIAKSRRQN
jgi:hypothetical protein